MHKSTPILALCAISSLLGCGQQTAQPVGAQPISAPAAAATPVATAPNDAPANGQATAPVQTQPPTAQADLPAVGPQAAKPVTAEAPVAAAADGQAPLTLTLSGPSQVQTQQTITLQAVAQAHGAMSDQARNGGLSWTVDVPAGARLVEPQKLPIAVTLDASGRAVLTLKVLLTSVPSQDLVVHVAGRGDGWGLNAHKTYGFGRAPSKLPETPSAPTMRLGGLQLAPIPTAKPTQNPTDPAKP